MEEWKDGRMEERKVLTRRLRHLSPPTRALFRTPRGDVKGLGIGLCPIFVCIFVHCRPVSRVQHPLIKPALHRCRGCRIGSLSRWAGRSPAPSPGRGPRNRSAMVVCIGRRSTRGCASLANEEKTGRPEAIVIRSRRRSRRLDGGRVGRRERRRERLTSECARARFFPSTGRGRGAEDSRGVNALLGTARSAPPVICTRSPHRCTGAGAGREPPLRATPLSRETAPRYGSAIRWRVARVRNDRRESRSAGVGPRTPERD